MKMKCLVLRFDAPLIGLGAVVVDQNHPVWRFPGKSMLTGLIANSMGWEHQEHEKLQNLQDNMKFAARWDVEPELMTDYQTVDLGQDIMMDTGWTTKGRPEKRGGGTTTSTHIRYRDYWANGVMTVVTTFKEKYELSLEEVEKALRQPARPLFLGRKTCLPASPLCLGTIEAESLKAALELWPAMHADKRIGSRKVSAMWPVDEETHTTTDLRFDNRNWKHKTHQGGERYAMGKLELKHV